MENINEILKDKDRQYIETSLMKMYNSEAKRTFLEEHLDLNNTRKGYVTYLAMISDWETLINKNCYDFNIEDAQSMFANQFTPYQLTLRALCTIATKYTDWAISRGLNKTGSNVFATLTFSKDILPFVDKKVMNAKYLSDDDIEFIISQIGTEPILNYQDIGVLLCLFHGIKGNEFIELQTLKAENIDVANSEITVICEMDEDENPIKTRKVQLPLEVIQILLKADAETTYNARSSVRILADSPYMFRNGQNKRSKTNMISYMVIRKRVADVLEPLGYKHTNPNDVYMSGKLAMLNRIKKEENRELTHEDFQIVNAMFNDDINNYDNLKTIYNLLDKEENK